MNRLLFFCFGLVALLFYIYVGYFLKRIDFLLLLTTYFTLFLLYIIFLNRYSRSYFIWLVAAGFAFRFSFIAAIPELSNDFYRFIWDGELLINGMNPYLFIPANTPAEVLNISQYQYNELFEGMGSLSAGNYSCYPPFNQLFFGVAAFLSGNTMGSVIVLRLVMIGADAGILIVGMKLLKKLKLPRANILLYFLNPLVIIELTGNLHFEGVMMLFLLWSVLLITDRKIAGSSIMLALSASVKLIPLVFLPIFMNNLGFRKGLTHAVLTIVLFGLLFIPFFSIETIANFFTSLDLFFRKFEFNASFYYIIREIGFQVRGYNIIQQAGPVLGIISLTVILVLSFFRKNRQPGVMLTGLLWILTIHYLLATTVHPWYIIPMIALGVFTKLRFPVIWSLLIVLSYSAYSHPDFKEKLILIGIEYFLLFAFIVWELSSLNKKDRFSLIS